MAVKDYENIIGIGFIGSIGIIALVLGIEPQTIAVAALSAIGGYIGGKVTGVVSSGA